jgi:hypothetical protein
MQLPLSNATAKGIPIIAAPIRTCCAFVLGSGKFKKDEADIRAVATCTRLGWEPPIPGLAPSHGLAPVEPFARQFPPICCSLPAFLQSQDSGLVH